MAVFSKLKQYNDLRKQANQLKSQLASETVKIENDAVEIIVDGNQEVKSLTINSSYLEAGRKAKLEEDIVKATNEAMKKVQRLMATKMREMGGFNIPGMGGGDNTNS